MYIKVIEIVTLPVYNERKCMNINYIIHVFNDNEWWIMFSLQTLILATEHGQERHYHLFYLKVSASEMLGWYFNYI